MSNLTKALLVMAAFAGLFRAGWWMAEQIDGEAVTFECVFDHMSGTFTATERKLQGDSKLITVARGDRVFMFRRVWLSGCVNTSDEDRQEHSDG